jgi:hypothetical protein
VQWRGGASRYQRGRTITLVRSAALIGDNGSLDRRMSHMMSVGGFRLLE